MLALKRMTGVAGYVGAEARTLDPEIQTIRVVARRFALPEAVYVHKCEQ